MASLLEKEQPQNGDRRTLNIETQLRLSAQRALWGSVPVCLRAASIEADGTEIIWRAIFDREPTDEERDLLQCAGTEIIADFSSPWTICEELLVVPTDERMEHRKHLVFLRWEL